MLGKKIDINKELGKLAVEEQNLRNKYGRRFASLYNTVVTTIANNTMIIDRAQKANKELDVELTDVINAMEVIQYDQV